MDKDDLSSISKELTNIHLNDSNDNEIIKLKSFSIEVPFEITNSLTPSNNTDQLIHNFKNNLNELNTTIILQHSCDKYNYKLDLNLHQVELFDPIKNRFELSFE
jgi:hypothetical protein